MPLRFKRSAPVVVPEFQRKNIPRPQHFNGFNLGRAIRICKKDNHSKPIAVLINTPNQFHDGLADVALDQGCHVYAERPINRHSDPLTHIIGLAEDKGLLLYNGVQRRLEATFRYMFHAIEKKLYFGKLSSIRCVLAAGRKVEGWRCNRDLAGGGIVIDEGYHLLDTATWLMEAAYPGISLNASNIKASVDFRYGETGNDIEIETSAVGFVILPHDVHISFDFSYNTPIGSVFEMIEARDSEGSIIRMLRNLPVRTPEPGIILHQQRSGKVIANGYINMDGYDNFVFGDKEISSGANNIGPLKQFLIQLSRVQAKSSKKVTRRTVGVNDCEARYVLNTQELIAAIYSGESA